MVETHYVNIRTEILTAQILAKEAAAAAAREHRNKENVSYVEISIPKSKENELKSRKTTVVDKVVNNKTTSSPALPKRKVVRICSRSSFVPIRLKSGEVVKTSKDILARLRQLKNNGDSKGEITVFNLPSSLQSKRVVHVPFSDRMSAALKRLSGNRTNTFTATSSPNKNGKIAKVLKLRSALDKSSVALQASTVRLKPKAGLMDHLNTYAKCASAEKPSILTDNKNLIPQKPSSLVPLVMKLKSHSQSTKLLPLSIALKTIANNAGYVNDHSTCNGSHSKE